ncbi:MAG: HAMP domain-containing histidine kinase [Myxococcales bacterium FL481]|nr:MAG: HAMP domain-containing histidine kinase [Myxococcales bacterium FL481]
MTSPRAPVHLTLVWIVAAVAVISAVVWAQHRSYQQRVIQTITAAERHHALAVARRLATSVRLAFALDDDELARDVAEAAIASDPSLRYAVLNFQSRPPLTVGLRDNSATLAHATVEHHSTSADMLVFGDWPLQQISGAGQALGQVEVGVVETGPWVDPGLARPPLEPLFLSIWLGTLAFAVGSAWWVRRRLINLADIAIDVATGHFGRAHERAQRLAGSDEFAWVGHQIQDIREYTREQVERVHDRNAGLLRDVTLQDERIARMSRLASRLVAPLDGDPTLTPVLEAIMRETDAVLGLLLDQEDEGAWRCLAAEGLRVPLDQVDANKLAWTLVPAEAARQGPSTAPPLMRTHPWLSYAKRQIPLSGIAQIPLVFGRRSPSYVVLAAPNRFVQADLEFFRDAAGPLAIALAGRRSYAESRKLTAALELRNAELMTQHDQLEVVDQLRQEFVANVSHELRTPLNAITCYAELMADGMYGAITPDQSTALAGIEQASRHLLELVNQVLDLSRAQAGHLPLHVELCELKDVLREAVSLATPLCRDRPYVPVLVGPGHRLRTDAERVYQIVTNLLNNAIKFTPTGEVTVCLTSLPDGGARIEIVDSGIGIAPEDIDAIFEPFRQADGSTTREHDGVGLGLHISRRLAQALGGTLSVTSQLGRGSVFVLELPARPPQQSQASAESRFSLGSDANRETSLAS